jgi:hypothetical protein
MPRFLIHQHPHAPPECAVVFAASRGDDSPLRHRATLASCGFGGHAIWWAVDAATATDALALFPFNLDERTRATRVAEVGIP